ncbi:MAG: UDP-glucose 4-epimerase GalE [Defluviitaleaceae bacterium]|nr:UDP-glucose 4-epimerase GalE [Defluviitaleaceae bacterium]
MILVCGGAGYIGSHMTAYLQERGKEVVVVDSLVMGHRESIKDTKLYVGDLCDSDFLGKVFSENPIEAVIDFAAFSLVGESMTAPLKYFGNNVGGTIALLETMLKHDVNKIVFSSTAAVYGKQEVIPIPETAATRPENPYGASKLMVEDILKWCDSCHGLKYSVLRYFNVAGAHPSGNIGEDHSPESHLIPIIAQAALNKREKVTIYGDDYLTPDGTCIRDYIHVMDLVEAHDLALGKLRQQNQSHTYNLGNGKGFSVKEVIETFEKVIGRTIPKEVANRRPGDPAVLIAGSEKAMTKLNWQPKYNSLETIISTAWNWHSKNPYGYARSVLNE